MNSKALLFVLLVLAPLAAHAQSPTPAAEVALVTGSVTAAGPGGARSLGSGDKVYAGDTISVAVNSYCNLHFADGGRVLLRPGSEFVVEAFKYAAPAEPAKPGAGAPAAGGASEAFFKLLRGGFRAISGLIGKTERANYRVTTAVATIGIRGTDYEVQTCEGDCPTEGIKASNESTLVAAAGKLQLADASGAQHGVVVATNEGSVVLKTPKGEFAVDAGHVALTLAGGQVFMLPAVPDVLLRNHTPSPEHCQ
jgi:hypothetical protein